MKKEESKKELKKEKPIVMYHKNQHAWSVKKSIGVLSHLIKKNDRIQFQVKENQEVKIDDPIAIIGSCVLKSPFDGVIDEINVGLQEVSINGSDWIARYK